MTAVSLAIWTQLALPAVGAASGSYVWLLVQTVTKHRAGWMTEAVIPAIMGVYTALFLSPRPVLNLQHAGVLSFGVIAGLLFDRGSKLETGKLCPQGSSNPFPMLLAGAAMASYIAGPGGWTTTLSQVAGFAFLGQAAGGVGRLRKTAAAARKPAKPNRALLSGFVAAALAIWLALPHATVQPSASTLLVTPLGEKPPIYLLDLKTSTYERLGIEGATPAWSPDGSLLLFTVNEGTDFNAIWIAAADGSSSRKVATVHGLVFDPLFSGDSRNIFYVHGTSWVRKGLWTVPVDGGSPKQILPDDDTIWKISLSPDGKELAHDNNDWGGNPELRLLDVATGKTTTLFGDPTKQWGISGLAWRPDGRELIVSMHILSSSGGLQPHHLERVSVPDGRRAMLLAEVPYLIARFAFVPDGCGRVPGYQQDIHQYF
jgi:hypothetical protein